VEQRDVQFVTKGWDVNPVAVQWLKEQNLLLDPYKNRVEHVSFWDAMEHIPDVAKILESVRQYAFITVPIFEGAEHILRSRHFRKDEHCWYWTRDGLLRWMWAQGFRCVEHNTMESLLGREDSHTFVFQRRTRSW
jgi:hypothetical protein